jgi:hypothetical protein
VAVPSFGPKMVCTKCGTIGADVRPNWRHYHYAVQNAARVDGPRRALAPYLSRASTRQTVRACRSLCRSPSERRGRSTRLQCLSLTSRRSSVWL